MPDGSRIRTSLNQALSGFTTPEEQALRMTELERLLWNRFGAIVLRTSDKGLGDIVSVWGEQRFGKRKAA